MDLQLLSNLETKTFSLAQQRHDEAAELTRDGMLCLLEARDEGFTDPELLAEACEYLLDAIRHNRNDPDPYIGMGYLLWLIGESAEAAPYLLEALHLDPGNSDATQLLELTRQPLATAPQPQAPPPIAVEPELDYDRLYDELEAYITREVQQLSALPPKAFAITDQRERIERMERRFETLSQTQAEIQASLAAVEEEIDCSELRQKLRPFDVLLKRCGASLSRSWELIQLQEVIAGHSRWLQRELGRFEARNGELPEDFSQERFEALLGDCDALADQLDALEQEGLEAGELITAYERLAQQVTILQELLDQT